jgi:hypothetical protein
MTNINNLKQKQPQYILNLLIDNINSGVDDLIESGEIPPYEWVVVDNSNNFNEGSIEHRVSEIMNDMYVDYVEYKNLGAVLRLVRNKRYMTERNN